MGISRDGLYPYICDKSTAVGCGCFLRAAAFTAAQKGELFVALKTIGRHSNIISGDEGFCCLLLIWNAKVASYSATSDPD
jgi:hypothetical protein